MRPKHWARNGIVFVALIFSKNMFNYNLLVITLFAFAIFCLLSGGVYLFNDIVDIEKDKRHPRKSFRPITSGNLNRRVAQACMIASFAISIAGSLLINLSFALVVIGYLVLQIAYSTFLKEIVIIDIFSIAAGFFLRVIAGAKAIEVPVSSWLLICTIFVSLFLGLGKRRHELMLLGEEAVEHRRVFDGYNILLTDQMVSVATAGMVISYSLYTLSQETVNRFHTEKMWLTIPIVLYGIFRYLYLVYRRQQGGDPELTIFEDRPLMFAVALYIVTVGLIVYV